MHVQEALVVWDGARMGEGKPCTWAWGLALRMPPVLVERSKESENFNFEPSLPGWCQGGENGTYFFSLLAWFITFKYLNTYL